jgi:signal transduction histidine kinase
VIARALRAVWDEPRVPPPPTRPRADVVLVAVLVPASLVEGVLRDDVPWPAYTIALAMVCAVAVLWRARYPLAMLLVSFGAQTLAGVGPALAGREQGVLYTTSVVLLFGYSLARWGSGRHVAVGVAALMAAHFLREPLYGSTATDNLVGAGFLLFPVALGAAVRFWVSTRHREREQARQRERERLARELHDIVGHHVSGIVIQAQAGQAVAATDPQRALQVLGVIEEAASGALVEVRSLVGVLRGGDDAERAPARGIDDLQRLARDAVGGPGVDVEVSGDVGSLTASVGAAVYRVVQESLTNARWHAADATRLDVRVRADDEAVHVDVLDDGRSGRGTERIGGRGHGSGFGVAGMRERVELLGGRLEAGPRPGGGWAVSAVIPRVGAR